MRLIILIILLFSFQLSAQPYFDLVNIHAAAETAGSIENKKDQERINYNWWLFNLNIPFELNSKNIIVFSPGYEQRTFTVNSIKEKQGFSSPGAFGFKVNENITYQAIYFPFSAQHTLKDSSNKISGAFIYRYNKLKSLDAGTSNDMFGGALLFSRRVNNHFLWKAGLYYNREFFGNYWLPLVGVEWQVNRKLFMWGLLPRNFVIDYCIIPTVHAGFSYKGIEESYLKSYDESFFIISEGQLKLFTDIYISHTGIVLTAEAGITAAKEFQFQEFPKSDFLKYATIPEYGGLIIKAGINYRISTNTAFTIPRKPAD